MGDRQAGDEAGQGAQTWQTLNWFEHGELLGRVWQAWGAWMEGDKGPDWRKAHADIMPLIKWLRELVYG
jgi:hypothetical protein